MAGQSPARRRIAVGTGGLRRQCQPRLRDFKGWGLFANATGGKNAYHQRDKQGVEGLFH